MDQKVVNLNTAPKIISDIKANLGIPTDELSKLELGLKEEEKCYQDFLLTDPTKIHGVSPGLEKIRDWVKERDQLLANLEKAREERAEQREILHKEIKMLSRQLEAVKQTVVEREERLEKAINDRERDNRFSESLSNENVFQEFIEYHSTRLMDLLDSKSISLTGCDSMDRILFEDAKKNRKTYAMDFGYAPSRFSSIKTLTAVYGELALELGYKPRQSFYDGICALLKKSGMRRILEIGSGDRGIVNLLSESGIANECNLELFAIERYISEAKKSEFEASGITLFNDDAFKIKNLLHKNPIDILLAVGVFSFGGLGEKSAEESVFKAYRDTVNKAHKLLDVSSSILSDHPNAFLAIGSVHGVHALFKDRLNLEAKYWQKGIQSAYNVERKRIQSYSPIPNTNQHNTTAQGREWGRWMEANKEELAFTDSLIDQSADLAILKKTKIKKFGLKSLVPGSKSFKNF